MPGVCKHPFSKGVHLFSLGNVYYLLAISVHFPLEYYFMMCSVDMSCGVVFTMDVVKNRLSTAGSSQHWEKLHSVRPLETHRRAGRKLSEHWVKQEQCETPGEHTEGQAHTFTLKTTKDF